jgi:hypothetical protein
VNDEYGARSRVLLKVKLGTPQNELRRNMKTPDRDSQSPGNDSNRPSDEIHFVFRYTNLLVCNVSWYRYVVRLLMTSVIITREFSKIKVTVNRAELPGEQQFVDYAKRMFSIRVLRVFLCVRKITAKSGLASSTTEWLQPDRFRFWLKSDNIITHLA